MSLWWELKDESKICMKVFREWTFAQAVLGMKPFGHLHGKMGVRAENLETLLAAMATDARCLFKRVQLAELRHTQALAPEEDDEEEPFEDAFEEAAWLLEGGAGDTSFF